MKKIFTTILSVSSYFALANTTFAAPVISNCSLTGMNTLKDIIMNFVVGCVISRSIYLFIALAVVFFLLGVFRFIRSEGDDRQSGKEFMFWGIIGLFVIISIWGLVSILQNTFNLSGNYDITPRQIYIQNL